MLLVTNRSVPEDANEHKGGPGLLGKHPNHNGPNELRLVEATKRAGRWTLEVLPDEVTPAMKRAVGRRADAPLSVVDWAAEKILKAIQPRPRPSGGKTKGKNVLLYVHGYNNDVEDVLERSLVMSRKFGVEVMPFTWPANGGGIVGGTLSYKSDKRDAKVSIGAFDRTLAFVGDQLRRVNELRIEQIRRKAAERHPDNLESQRRLVSELLDKQCPFSINLLLHSMGNYLYKHLLLSSASEGTGLVFDNVVLCAADANNKDHARWVDRIRCRHRVYVTINEDDIALRASRLKSGSDQLARLGHYPFNLTSEHAAYVQFTSARHVGRSHAYFADDALKNASIRTFFRKVLNGERADQQLDYDPGSNTYRF
ncbi:MAG: alpha/beta hydrolase [Planctomycetota bacterium]|jgi:hypothetical protein